MDTGWIAWKGGPECFSFLRTDILSLSRVESDGSCVKQMSNPEWWPEDVQQLLVYLSLHHSLWSVDNEQSLAHISSELELINMCVKHRVSRPFISWKAQELWYMTDRSVFILQSHLHIHKTCFDINNAPYPILLTWVCACTKEYTAAWSKRYFGILYILLVFTTTSYTTSIYEYLNELLQF